MQKSGGKIDRATRPSAFESRGSYDEARGASGERQRTIRLIGRGASATHGSHAPCLHLLRSRRTLQLLDADSKHTPKAAKRELAQRTDLVARKGERAEAMVERYLVGYDEHVRAKLMHLKKRELLALYAYTERTETWKALEAIFAGL